MCPYVALLFNQGSFPYASTGSRYCGGLSPLKADTKKVYVSIVTSVAAAVVVVDEA